MTTEMLDLPAIRSLVETDISDDALQIVALGEWEDLINRFGTDDEKTVTLVGGHLQLILLDGYSALSEIVEVYYYGQDQPTELTMEADDYTVRAGGKILERLPSGTNPAWRWAGRVRVTYTPPSKTNLRYRVHADLIKLALNYNGVAEEWFGDYKSKFPNSYHTARERIMRQMATNRGMILA